MQVELIVSAVSAQDFPPPGMPEVVLAGRSNVGKSSLINRLVGQRYLARTSATPGKTQSINFYQVSRAFILVDLPGYGYAKVGRATRRQWGRLIEDYFQAGRDIALVIHLLDAGIPPTVLDITLANWLERLGVARILAATKADKLSGNAKTSQLRIITAAFGNSPVLLVSAVTGMGCQEIWQRVEEVTRRTPSARE